MTPLVNQYNALNGEGRKVSDRIEKALTPLVKELLSEGQYSAREIAGIFLQSIDLLIAETVLKRSLGDDKEGNEEDAMARMLARRG